MIRRLFVIFLAFAVFAPVVSNSLMAQRQRQQRDNKTLRDQWMDYFTWRSIGPANMSGRITALSVYEADPTIWYVATASGGLLKTVNNGINFEHQFDNQSTVSIGDVQVCQTDPNIVWVGTGESNPRNSVSWGDGVYKSVDGGKTWRNMGLKKSFQIGHIAIHPEDPDTVFVGAVGRLWGPSEERGLFKTTDGGKTWDKVLYIDENTGVVDVKINPEDPDIILAAAYDRQRDGFDGNDPARKYGDGSGLFRSTDGGETFEEVTDGMPSGKKGRISVDWYRKDPNLVYAIVESEIIATGLQAYAGISGADADIGARLNQISEDSPAEEAGLKEGDIVLKVNDAMVMSYNELLAEFRRHRAGDELEIEVSRNREMVEVTLTLAEGRQPRRGLSKPDYLRGTLGGQAADRQGQQHGPNDEPEEEFGGIYLSEDAGKSWKRINTLNPRPMYYSEIRVDPSNNDYLYVLGTSLYRSTDGGETFSRDGGRGIHPDNHAMWIDPNEGKHIVLGNDGGMYVTWDRMDNWDHYNHVAIGQFYHVGVDQNRDYNVYGGLQDNGSWGGPAQTRTGGTKNTDWFRVGSGDGFITLVDPNDADQIYFESQNGGMGRINLRTGDRGFIRPGRPTGGSRRPSYRFNWKTPFILSPHNPKIHYSAGNFVFRSYWKGDGLTAISPEITNTNRGAGSAISESPVTAGVIYVGTTDGAVWMTRDGGINWEAVFSSKADAEDEAEETSDTTPPAAGRGQRGQGRGQQGQGQGRRPRGNRGGGAPDARERPGRGNRPQRGNRSQRNDDPEETEEKSEESDPEEGNARTTGESKKEAEVDSAVKPLLGVWKGEMTFDDLPDDQRWVELKLTAGEEGGLAGTFTTPRSVSQLSEFSFDKDSGKLTFDGANGERDVTFECELEKTESENHWLRGVIKVGQFMIDFEVQKTDEGRFPIPESNFEPIQTINPATPMKLVGYRVADKVVDDPVTGVWTGLVQSDDVPGGEMEFTIEMKLKDKSITGQVSSMMGELEIVEGSFNAESGKLRLELYSETMQADAEITGEISEDSMEGMIRGGGGEFEVDFTAERSEEENTESANGDEKSETKPQAERSSATRRTNRQERTRSTRSTRRSSGAVRQTSDSNATESTKTASTQQEEEVATDGVTGVWEGRIISDSGFAAGERGKLTFNLIQGKDNKLKGSGTAISNEGTVSAGKFDPEKNEVEFTFEMERFELEFTGVMQNEKIIGELDFSGRRSFDFEVKRTSKKVDENAVASEEPETVSGQRLEELVPGPRWVSSIEASRFRPGRVYLTMDGHRSNDDEPYVFVSENYGKTWTSLRANLPTSAGTTRVIREDIENQNLLFLGCEFSAWVSVDRGKSWTKFQGGLPTVAVHEFAIHESSGEIIAGTHGRSLWVADISGLRQLSEEVLSEEVALMQPNDVVRWRRAPEQGSSGTRRFIGENPDSNAEIYYYIGGRVQNVRMTVYDIRGNLVRTLDAPSTPGLHQVVWDLRPEPPAQQQQQRQQQQRRRFGRAAVASGQYLVVLNAGGQEYKVTLNIQQDPEQSAPVVSEEEWEWLKYVEGLEEEVESDR